MNKTIMRLFEGFEGYHYKVDDMYIFKLRYKYARGELFSIYRMYKPAHLTPLGAQLKPTRYMKRLGDLFEVLMAITEEKRTFEKKVGRR